MAKEIKLRVKGGWLIAETHEGDYPGIWVYFSENGEADARQLVTIVEYEAYSASILHVAYTPTSEEPASILRTPTELWKTEK